MERMKKQARPRLNCVRHPHRLSTPSGIVKLCAFIAILQIVQAQENLLQTRGRLCCPVDHDYIPETKTCRPTPLNNASMIFNPQIYLTNATNVSWEYQELKCPYGYHPQSYSLNEYSELLLEDGIIILNYEDLFLKKTEEFCVGRLTLEEYVGVTCRPNITQLCEDTTCVQKCCGEGEIASISTLSCIPSTSGNRSFKFHSVKGFEVPAPSDLQWLYRVPDCQSIVRYDPAEEPSESFYLTKEGFLYRPDKDLEVEENQFCVDHFETEETEAQLGAFVCSGPPLPTEPAWKFYVFATGAMISIIALLFTILCYNINPKLRAMQDYNQLCHMVSLVVGEITLFIGYVFTNDIHRTQCAINSIIQQFALLSAFFWLNVMCFDIHQYIRATLKCIPRAAIQGGKSLRFRCYCAYAWGCPLLITLATVILHYAPNHIDGAILRPGFAIFTCWFSGDLERLTFFYIWIAALFVGNIFLLGNTAFMLYRAGVIFRNGKKSDLEEGENRATNRGNAEKLCVQTTAMGRGSDSWTDGRRFWHSFSLFALMALCWVTEILSWKIPPTYIWVPTDILNTLQGFFIFVFFIRIKKRRELVKESMKKVGFRVSETARKLSRAETSSGAMWHYNNSKTLETEMDSDSYQKMTSNDEQRDQKVTSNADQRD